MRPRSRQRGAALVLAVSVLAVLTIIAIGFGRLMTFERDGARNYSLATHARMASCAGVEAALARLRADAAAGRLDDVAGEWRYFGEDANRDFRSDAGEDSNLNGLVEREECPLSEVASPSYAVSGKPYSGLLPGTDLPKGWTVRYRLRVRDSQGMLNLNLGTNDLYTSWVIDHLGAAIRKHLAHRRDVIAAIVYPDPADPARTVTGGTALLAYRDTLPGKRFATLRDLIPILERGRDDLEILAPYATVNSWIDPRTYRNEPLPGTGWERHFGPVNLVASPLPPVNINTAPRPVLAAAIGGSASWVQYWSTQQRYKSHRAGSSALAYDYVDHRGHRFQHYTPGNNWQLKRYYVGLWAWYWLPSEPMFESWTRPIHERRVGEETDANGNNAAEPAEDTSFPNRVLDLGPFRGGQDWRDYIDRFDGVWWESQAGGLLPHGMIQRYNPEFMASAFFHDAGGVRQFNYDEYGLADRTNVYRLGPAWCWRSHGYFQVTSLGEVLDADGEVVARHEVDVDTRLFHPLVVSSQKDFVTIPARDWTYRIGEPYVGRPIDRPADHLAGVTTFPENLRDATDGSDGFDTDKAEEFFGGVHLAPSDEIGHPDCIFAANYASTFRAERAVAGSEVPGVGRNLANGRVAASAVQDDRTIGRKLFRDSSDLFVDGLHVNRWRNRRCTYGNPGFGNMRPDRGALEMWVKFRAFTEPGDLVTAFFPADPTTEATSTEGISFRVYLGYIPARTTEFDWFRDPLLPRKYTHPIRHWAWGWTNQADVMKVPVLAAERIFYTAVLDGPEGKYHGRDAAFKDLGTKATYDGTRYSFESDSFVDWEFYPLTNWAKDGLWHKVEVRWRNGTDVDLLVDGVDAPFSYSIPKSGVRKGDYYVPFAERQGLAPEIHVGGTSLVENPTRWDGFAASYGTDVAQQVRRWPAPHWLAGSYNNPPVWRPSVTIDQLRVYDQPDVVLPAARYDPADRHDFMGIVQFPENATRLLSMAWEQFQPEFDPDNFGDPVWKHGLYLPPAKRPIIEMGIRTRWGGTGGSTIRFDERSLQTRLGLSIEEARRLARFGGVALDLELEPSERIRYDAVWNLRNLSRCRVSPILECVKFFYTGRMIEILRWEEAS